MKGNTIVILMLFAALALFTVPADAANLVNDSTDISLQVLSPALQAEPEKQWT